MDPNINTSVGWCYENLKQTCAESNRASATIVTDGVALTTDVCNHGATRTSPWVIERANHVVVESLLVLTQLNVTEVAFQADVVLTTTAEGAIFGNCEFVLTKTNHTVAQAGFALGTKT